MPLLAPLQLGSVTARNRVMFGPHVTNLGDDHRRFTARHTAYYERRARGGCGVIVTEGASVHPSDWPYERAPLASACADGWAAIATACHAHGATVLASLDHAGGQGSSAYSQRELWAPSRVPEVNAREVPKWMEADDIAAVVQGFADAAATAVAAGCDGVEINAGQHSLVRQFLSGLTNHRGDEWAERTLFAKQVIRVVRAAVGDAVVGLRLSCDELAPWAGITPEMAPAIAAELVAEGIDYVVVVRGSIFSVEKTRPDFHEPPGFNIAVCQAVKAVLPTTPVFLQGSLDVATAGWALAEKVADAAEITRGQIADPDLVEKLADKLIDRIRPCIRCNQTCQVRDGRNPIVTCVGEPSSGHETDDPNWLAVSPRPRDVVIVGGGVAGMETARIAATRGHHVRLVERSDQLGGVAALLPHAAPLVDWLARAVEDAGVRVELRSDRIDATADEVIVQCTGAVPGTVPFQVADGATVVDVLDAWQAVFHGADAPWPVAGAIVLFDPIGGPIAVALAEQLGDRAVLVTQDQIAGNELSRTGDLAPANTRLAQRGARIERRSLLRVVRPGEVELEDRFSGERRTVECVAVVDCGFRLPTEPLPDAQYQAGDCVAPRTILEAVLEGRRAALSL
ncbi:MAG: mycofactocin system FadH/OYE family oxidoreductase 1 [Actinobacteria bacterium]|nr:mycofactocin system FadH/OYE family oxidoreductase 1 [Actinomycetota bacterium]